MILPRSFYARDTVKVARSLPGNVLVRVSGKVVMRGRIVEVEAYRGLDDPASHAFRGQTPRNAPMFGEPGHAYVYFTYGNHYCLNVTTQKIGTPGAVLIRAVEPLQGLRTMKRLRPNVEDLNLTSGPGKLTKALGIDLSLNKVDMTERGPLYIEESKEGRFRLERSPRVGIGQGAERLWRFYVAASPYVSKR